MNSSSIRILAVIQSHVSEDHCFDPERAQRCGTCGFLMGALQTRRKWGGEPELMMTSMGDPS